YQSVYLCLCIVDVEAGAGGGDAIEAAHQGLGAVVAGADGDAERVQVLTEVVRVDVAVVEGDDPGALVGVGWAIDRHLGQRADAIEGVGDDLFLPRAHVVHAQSFEIVDGGSEGD